jgi:hypothetical protein
MRSRLADTSRSQHDDAMRGSSLVPGGPVDELRRAAAMRRRTLVAVLVVPLMTGACAPYPPASLRDLPTFCRRTVQNQKGKERTRNGYLLKTL